MNTLICKNCGSSSFIKIKENYQCQHCSSILVREKTYTNRRIKLIVGILGVLLLIAILSYRGIVGVEKKLDKLEYTKEKEIKQQKNKSFVELDKLIKKKITKKLGHFPLEKVLIAYNKETSEKALFVSLNRDGKYAYGYAVGRGNIKEASTNAFTICEIERKKRALTQLCMPYLINNYISPRLVE